MNVPVPTMNLSADSSNPINPLFESPLSITIPLSPAGEPVVPFPSSISLSLIVVLVVEAEVVSPFTTKLPVIVTLFWKVLFPAIELANPIVAVPPEPSVIEPFDTSISSDVPWISNPTLPWTAVLLELP